MPRPPRLSAPGTVHHVVNRCNHQEQLLSYLDFQDCCALLLEAKSRFRIRIFAYAFLHNHYHLLIQETVSESVSRAMHWFNGTAAARYNIRHEIKGHLWQGRFKNRVIESDTDLLGCILYIDLNPARAGLSLQATDWPFCSARSHVDGCPDTLLDTAPLDLKGYSELFAAEWEKTRKLQQALERADRGAIKSWLRQSFTVKFIPFRKEIVQLVGRNYRQLVAKPKADEKG